MAISKAWNHTKTNATNIKLISGIVSFLTKETRLVTFLQISGLQRTPMHSAKSKYSQGFSVLLGNRRCFAMICFAKLYFKNSIKFKTCIYGICTFGQPLQCMYKCDVHILRPSSNAKIVMTYIYVSRLEVVTLNPLNFGLFTKKFFKHIMISK